MNIVDFYDGRAVPLRPNEVFTDPDAVSLATAIEEDDLDKVRALIAKGVPVEALGKKSVTPLAWAYMKRNKPAFRFLLEQGADPNHLIGKTMPVIYIVAEDRTDSEWLELALKFKGDPNIVNRLREGPDRNKTPIFSAIDSRRKESLELLIKAGADLNYQGPGGWTPAAYAIHAPVKSLDFAFYLLEAGADFKLQSNRGRSLAYEVICARVDPEGEMDQWREKIIAFMERNGVDFAVEVEKVDDPDAREIWNERLERIARAKTGS